MTGLLVVGGIVVALWLGHKADKRRSKFYDDYMKRREDEERQRK